MSQDPSTLDLLSYLADLASLFEFVAVLAFFGLVVYAIAKIKDIPRSFFRLKALGMEAEMSVGDVSFLIEDQIGAVDEDQVAMLERFSPKDATAPEGLDQETVKRLEARGVVRRYRDAQGTESVRLSPLGYRLLNDFKKDVQFDKRIWDWLNKRSGETLL